MSILFTFINFLVQQKPWVRFGTNSMTGRTLRKTKTYSCAHCFDQKHIIHAIIDIAAEQNFYQSRMAVRYVVTPMRTVSSENLEKKVKEL